jgi:hypothetical protein
MLAAPNPQPTPQTAPKNAISFDDLLKVAADLGADAGKGKDTQIKFLLKAVEGGYHNALDLTANKHGALIDDATKLAETYVKARQGAVVFDAKADNQQKLSSTLRTAIKLGSWPKGGNGEPLATVNNLMTIRQNLKKVPSEAKKLDDAANTLMKYARAQLKRDTLCDDAELKSFCYKPGKQTPTVEDVLEEIAKKLDKLVSGEYAGGTLQDNSTNVKTARFELHQRLAAIAKGKNGGGMPRKSP